MNSELTKQIKNINKKEDFIIFIRLLREDFQLNSEEWENPTIDMFLEAMDNWVEDMDNYYKNNNKEVPKNISWKIFADILIASKLYE